MPEFTPVLRSPAAALALTLLSSTLLWAQASPEPPTAVPAPAPGDVDPARAELGSHASGWVGLGTTSLTQDARGADASGSVFDVSLGVDVRLADPGGFPLAALLAYEANWGLIGYDDREVLDRRGNGDLTHEAHLVEAGLGLSFLTVPRLMALYPYAAYTLSWERLDRDDFRPNRPPPIPLRGFESHDRILAHGPGAGVQLAFRFGTFGGLDFGLSYAYLFDVRVDSRSDLVSNLDTFETTGHAVRLATSLWFRINDALTLGLRIGSGLRYLRKDSQYQGGTRVTWPDTYLSPSNFGFQVRWRF